MKEVDALVTGGTGFLWRTILREPLSARFRLGFLGRTRPDRHSPFEFVDLAAPEALNRGPEFLHSPIFLHFAAPTPLPGIPIAAEESDRMAGNAAAIAIRRGAKYLVHASSGAIYGLSWPGRRAEEDPAAPASDYGRSKWSAERLLDSLFTDGAAGRGTTHLRLHFPAPSVDALRQETSGNDCHRLFARLARHLVTDSSIRLEASAFRMNPCPGAALVALLEAFLEGRRPPAGIVNVAGGRSCALEEAIMEMAERLGRIPSFERGNGPEGSMLTDVRRFRSLVGDVVDLPLF